MSSFKKLLTELKPSVFFIQESKINEEGKLKFQNYELFEMVREGKEGGGLLIGCIPELKPVLASKGTNEVEAMSVDIYVKTMKIRCVVAYGCQENSPVEKKKEFWNFLENEAKTAHESNSGFILQFDGNLWAGPNIVPGDPRPQNRNGKLFEEFLSRQKQLTVVNSLPVCEGLISRMRVKNGKEEKSVLDFFVVCSRVLPHVSRMKIDDDKKHILTNFKPARKGRAATDSDHFTEILDVNLEIVPEKPKRIEIYDFKDMKAQVLFKDKTSNTDEFSKCFNNSKNIEEQICQWRRVLNTFCKMVFKKIRINTKKKMKPLSSEIISLINQRNKLLKEHLKCEKCVKIFRTESGLEKHVKYNHQDEIFFNCTECADKIHRKCQPNDHNEIYKIRDIEKRIAEIEAEEKRNIILSRFKKFSENPENVNLHEIWNVLKRICPKYKKSIPMAKRNHVGKIISHPDQIKMLLAKEYKQRLRARPKRSDLGDLKTRRNEIFNLQMKLAEENKSQKWNIEDLERALKGLKNNKSRDHAGFVNEIFKPGVIGSDLKKSLLIMFNNLKAKNIIPNFMKYANITTIPKKGSLLELENERGIFRVDVIRSILMKMIYNQNYPNIDKNISDSQMGGRKNKGCRNNIFMVNGIIHDVLSSKNKPPVMLQIYDYSQMFDSIDLKQAISDIFEAGLRNDNLPLIYKANNKISMAVNTPSGITQRQEISDTVLQGDTFGCLLASVQVDTIGKECSQAGYGYNYMEELPVGILGLVDDTIAVTEAGYKATEMNTFMNIKTAEKGLQFGAKKCKSMLVGNNTEKVLKSKLFVDKWSVEHKENRATGDTDLVEKYEGQVEIASCDEQKYLGFVISNKSDNMANIRAIKNRSFGIIKKIFSKLNSLNLNKYYFECGIIFMNVMLRSSILHGSECYYNLKEQEIRQLERIEESFMRQLLKTKKSCPINQLYTELGQLPARFDIMKLRLFFLKYILNQDPQSGIYRMYHLQLENPKRGDWASTCRKNMKDLNVNLSNEEIRKMSKNVFKNLIRKKCKEKGFEYLMKRRGKKGQNIKYSCLKMSEYLLPNQEFSIENQRNIFEIRNNMTNIASNFTSEEKNESVCICGERDNMKHIFICEQLNKEQPTEEYEQIYGENLIKMKYVLNRFNENLNQREKLEKIERIDKQNHQEILVCDPQQFVVMDNK